MNRRKPDLRRTGADDDGGYNIGGGRPRSRNRGGGSRDFDDDDPLKHHNDDDGGGEDAEFIVVTENKLLKIEMDDLISQLEMLKHEYDVVNQRLSDARKEKDRREHDFDDERRRFDDRLRDAETATRLDVQRQLEGRAHATDGRVRELESTVDRLNAEVDHRTRAAGELSAELARLRADTTGKVKSIVELEDRVERLTRAAQEESRRAAAAVVDAETARRTRVPVERESDLTAQVDQLAATVRSRDRLIEEISAKKHDLLTARSAAEKRVDDLAAQLKAAQRDAAEAKYADEEREREVARLRADVDRLRAQKKEQDDEHLRGLVQYEALEERQRAAGDRVRPLQDLVREQEAHIADLRRETETLRTAVADYQAETNRLQAALAGDVAAGGKFEDLAEAHRRLIDENARLLAMLDQRQLAESKAVAEQAGARTAFDEAKRKLKSTAQRVAQLENWLDEIYNDKNFDVVARPGAVKAAAAATVGRRLPAGRLSLPAIAAVNVDARRKAMTRQYLFERKMKSTGYFTDRV